VWESFLPLPSPSELFFFFPLFFSGLGPGRLKGRKRQGLLPSGVFFLPFFFFSPRCAFLLFSPDGFRPIKLVWILYIFTPTPIVFFFFFLYFPPFFLGPPLPFLFLFLPFSMCQHLGPPAREEECSCDKANRQGTMRSHSVLPAELFLPDDRNRRRSTSLPRVSSSSLPPHRGRPNGKVYRSEQ